MQATIYLRLDRVDLAAKSVKAMQDIDDDDTLTQLSQSWLYIHQGGEKVTEASFILQELLEKFGPSDKVFNSLAVCQMHLRNYPQALQYLKQAREQSTKNKAPVSGETFVNSLICLQHLRKSSDVMSKILAEFKSVYPNHSWFKKQEELERLFDKPASSYK